jgi:hypothetical protein
MKARYQPLFGFSLIDLACAIVLTMMGVVSALTMFALPAPPLTAAGAAHLVRTSQSDPDAVVAACNQKALTTRGGGPAIDGGD